MKATDKLLKEVGAVLEGTSGNANRKYRLPGGAIYIRSHESVGRTALNEYKTLVRLVNGLTARGMAGE